MFYKKKNKKDNRVFTTGFTLVELLVAMAVFGILMSLAIGVFVSAMKAQRNLTDLMSVNNNLNLVLEQMSREMRMGYFSTAQYEAIMANINDPNAPCLSSISFTTMQTNDRVADGEEVTYAFSDAEKAITKNGSPITGQNVEVQKACFNVYEYKKSTNPSSNADYNCNPWRVSMTLSVKPKNAKPEVQPTFIETAVSMRVFPIEIKNDPFQCRRS